MSPTIKDIAKLADVSPATVSLVLNGKGEISAKTRARVQTAASSLKYARRGSKNVKATGLKTLRFLKIATHGRTVNRDHNVFISDYIDGMSHQAGLSGYQLEVVNHEEQSADDIAASLAGSALSGLIVLGTELGKADIQRLQRVGVPLVVIDAYHDGLECDFVNMNNKDALHQILFHLIERGFRHVGFIASDVRTVNFQLRHEAFSECMKSFGLSFSPLDIVTVDSTFDGAYQDMAGKLRGGLVLPECYVSTNDIITFGCIKAFREFNLRIPQDLSIVGFDNLPMSAAMDPPLTTIDVSKRKIGSLAISLLDEQIRSTEKQPAIKILVGANLITRDSVVTKAAAKQAQPTG